MRNHKGHYVIISTETLKEIKDENKHDTILNKEGRAEQEGGKRLKTKNMGEQTSHDMTRIAIVKETTILILQMRQAIKGNISPIKRTMKN